MHRRRDNLTASRSVLSRMFIAATALTVLGGGLLAPAQAETVRDPVHTAPDALTSSLDPAPEPSSLLPGSAPSLSPTEVPPEQAPAPALAPTPDAATPAPSDPLLAPAEPQPPEAAPSPPSLPDQPVEEGTVVVPFLVPPATGNNAVISVKVGGDRTSLVAVGPLAGVTLQLYADGATPGAALTDPWATCVSDAAGDCSFVVPNTQSGGANFNRRFWIAQTGVPTGWYANPTLGTGSAGATATPYQFRTGTALVAGTTYTSQGAFMLSTGNTNATASGGIWQSSRTNPTLPAQCGVDVALILDQIGRAHV